MALVARAGRVDEEWRGDLDVLPERAVEKQIEEEFQHEGIDEDVYIPENKTTGDFGYAR